MRSMTRNIAIIIIIIIIATKYVSTKPALWLNEITMYNLVYSYKIRLLIITITTIYNYNYYRLNNESLFMYILYKNLQFFWTGLLPSSHRIRSFMPKSSKDGDKVFMWLISGIHSCHSAAQ